MPGAQNFPPLALGGLFQSLPGANLDYDALRRWLATQNINMAKLTAGELVLTEPGVIQSSDFVAGTSGWQIAYDGGAEFNDVTVRGDVSGNWNGADPANLTTYDAVATTGFYLDSSVGAAQFMGDLFLGGDAVLLGSGSFKTSPTASAYWELSAAGQDYVGGWTGQTNETAPGKLQTGYDPQSLGYEGIALISPTVTGQETASVTVQPSGVIWLQGDTHITPATSGYGLILESGTTADGTVMYLIWRRAGGGAIDGYIRTDGSGDGTSESSLEYYSGGQTHIFSGYGNKALIVFDDDGSNDGGNDSGIQYVDSGGTARYGLRFASDVVYISNRTANGKVHFMANNATAGSGGEKEVMYIDYQRLYLDSDVQEKLRLVNGSSTGAIQTWYDSGGSRDGWMGFYAARSTNGEFQLQNDRTDGVFRILLSDGTTIRTRFYIDGDGSVNFYDSSGSFAFVLTTTYSRLYQPLYLIDTNLKLDQASNTQLRVTTAYGYVDIGPQNSSWAHVYTDRAAFYFNKNISINGSYVMTRGATETVSGTKTFSATGTYFHSIFPTSDATYYNGDASHTWYSVRCVSIYRDNEYADSSKLLKKFVKEDIPGIDFLMDLKPVSFEWRSKKRSSGHYTRRWGFIAEDIFDVAEKHGHNTDDIALTHDDEDAGYKSYETSQIVPVLAKALQEAILELRELKARIGQLEAA